MVQISGQSATLHFAEFRRTAGDIVCDTAGAWGTLAGEAGGAAADFDITVTATAGDVLFLGLNAEWLQVTDTTTGRSGRFDFATIVSAAVVNYVSTRSSSSSSGGGISGFKSVPIQLAAATPESDYVAAGAGLAGPIPYTVQAGDISGGTVTLRPYVKVESTGRTLNASTGNPLVYWVLNMRALTA